jgi:ketosteroid isomerase-like protein
MTDDKEAITRTYTAYFQAFQTLNPQAVLPYYHVPSMLLSPQGVTIMATATEVEALFSQIIEGLKARNYARSELTDLRVQQLSDSIAMLSISGVRYTTDGEQLERLGVTYTLRKTDASWQIVLTTIHDPDSIIGLA